MAAHQTEECAGILARVGRVDLGVSQRAEGDQEDFSTSEWDGEEDEERRTPSSHLKQQTLGCDVLS